MIKKFYFTLVAMAMLLAPEQASAQALKVGVMGSCTDDGARVAAYLNTQTFQSISATGLVSGNITSASQLASYEAVVVFTNCGPNETTLGNVLADYVDTGKGVVEMVFSQYSGFAAHNH